MDFNNISLLSLNEEKTNNNNGSVFTKQQRSDDQQQQVQEFVKSSRSDYFDQPNKTMSSCLRSDSLLSLSPAANNNINNSNMLSFSSSSTNTTTKNVNSLFSFYQPSPAYITNTTTGMYFIFFFDICKFM